jgi:phage tail-like protein
MANVEGMYTALEGRIEQTQLLFDPDTVPSEYLDWLGGWFGVSLDEGWDDAKRRLFLTHAIQLFNQRGTLAGIIRAIRIALDPCPDESLFTEAVVACSSGRVAACPAGQKTSPFNVRLIEQYLTRSQPGVLYGDPTDVGQPGLTRVGKEWTPAQGAEPLHRRYRDYLATRYELPRNVALAWNRPITGFDQIFLSPVLPVAANDTAREDWRAFIQRDIGFFYTEVSEPDEPFYRQFLVQRYQQVDRLNSAYGRAYADFESVTLPAENDFPNGGSRLFDWIQFVSLVLPLKRQAHRFTVLVPTPLQSDRSLLSEQLELVRRVVALEKPAHTNFEVRQYWAMFRVGEARLGLDTVLDVGSRFAALVLGEGYLSGGYLAPAEPWNAADRIVAGRDQAGDQLIL